MKRHIVLHTMVILEWAVRINYNKWRLSMNINNYFSFVVNFLSNVGVKCRYFNHTQRDAADFFSVVEGLFKCYLVTTSTLNLIEASEGSFERKELIVKNGL